MAITLDEYGKWCKEKLDPIFEKLEDELAEDPDDEAQPIVDAKLKEVLGDRKVEYITADWKDHEGLVVGILDSKFDLRHSAVKIFLPFEEVEWGHGGSDDYVIIAVSGKATGDELDIIYDLIHNLGADVEGDN